MTESRGGEYWHRIDRDLGSVAGENRFYALAPCGSLWYEGHFPGNPVLPGIAVLAMVKESILAAENQQGRTIRMEGIRRVRFRLPVRPDDRLTVTFTLAAQGERLLYTFKVSLDGKMVCSGIFVGLLLPERSPFLEFLEKG